MRINSKDNATTENACKSGRNLFSVSKSNEQPLRSQLCPSFFSSSIFLSLLFVFSFSMVFAEAQPTHTMNYELGSYNSRKLDRFYFRIHRCKTNLLVFISVYSVVFMCVFVCRMRPHKYSMAINNARLSQMRNALYADITTCLN